MSMDSTLEKLAQYIMQQLRLGISEQDVRVALMQNGWAKPAIDGAFGIVHHYEAHPRLPQPMYEGQVAPNTGAQSVALPRAAAFPTSEPMISVQATQAPADTAQKTKKDGMSQKKIIRLVLAFILLIAIAFIAVIISLSGDSFSKFASHILGSSHGNQTQSQQTNGKQSAQKSKGTQAKPAPVDTDAVRKDELNTLLSNFSDFYVLHQAYPTTIQLNDPGFVFLPDEPSLRVIADPKWSAADKTCVGADGKAIFAAAPTPHCFAYIAVAKDGGVCDGTATVCTKLTLTATLENGQPYAISLDQNHAVN